ncbi:MAG: RagB/SusD family nutrient uptake outer membrane protein [Muribaculaceae bacterium]
MKNRLSLILLSIALCAAAVSCDDILDRPEKNVPSDSTFWKTESDLSLYANGFYANYFIGYGQSWSASYSPFRGYGFSDDVASTGTQANFTSSLPSSVFSTSESAVATYSDEYTCPSMVFSWIRKANIMMDRIETKAKANISAEAYNHWMAVAKFFKSYSYCRLVERFGDVPYFETQPDAADFDALYKDRDSRILVMDKVYDMSKDVLANMRTNDGADKLNRYVAAAFISRWFLFEGTWQKYHGGDQAAAKKYLEMARDAAQLVMDSGNYAIDKSVRELWGSQDLSSKEALMVRHFLSTESVTHCVASYSNSTESQSGLNLAFLKSVIRQDGKPYTTSSLCDGKDPKSLSLPVMGQTCDPRFEASISDLPVQASSTLVYQCKFIDRAAWNMSNAERGVQAIYQSYTNTNDAPVIRYAEVLLNWIEAKAELALIGGAAVTQDDIDRSINVLRDRPLDEVAKSKGLKNTVHMQLADINASFDPERDADVDALVWEVRRERRLELVFEHSRILDLRRWHKLDYMDNEAHPETMRGPWVDFANDKYKGPGKPTDANGQVAISGLLKVGSTQVQKLDGTIVTYDGNNIADMVGFYLPTAIKPRNAFYERSYLSPIGTQDISNYAVKGYTLTQTKGW